MLNDLALTVGIGTVILIAVLGYITYSRRNLAANVQRIKEEFGTPGERDMALGASVDAPLEEPPVQSATGDLVGQLDARIAQANQIIRAADERIARLENAIARADRVTGGSPPGEQPPR
jgi:hypothetical protein